MARRLFLSMLVLVGAVGSWAAASWLIPSTVADTISAQTRPIVPRPALQQLQINGITVFTATAATTRGQINLRWTYTGKAFRGTFLVERSNNRTTWAPVTSCSLSYSTRTTTYTCTDTKLTSGRSYYYRVCKPATGSKTCTSANATIPRRTPTTAP
jgi:hypothetical protein